MRNLGLASFLLAIAACASVQRRDADTCFLALSKGASGDSDQRSPEPWWVRLTGAYSDSSGVAQVGLYDDSTISGQWWRISADSIRVDVAGPFDAVWLRLNTARDTTAGTVELRTDADLLRSQIPLQSWAATRGTCPRR